MPECILEGAGQDGAPAVHAWRENLNVPPPLGPLPFLPHGVTQLSLFQAYALMGRDAVLACTASLNELCMHAGRFKHILQPWITDNELRCVCMHAQMHRAALD